MNAIPPIAQPGAETDEERRARELGVLREIVELGMVIARSAAARAVATADPENGAAEDDAQRADRHSAATLEFARATTAVRQAIALGARLSTLDVAPAAAAVQSRPSSPDSARPASSGPARLALVRPELPADKRRALVQKVLHDIIAKEPDRAARAALRQHADMRMEEELAADPEAAQFAGQITETICRELNLPLDVTKISDELLGFPPIPRFPDYTRTGPPEDE